MLRWLPLALFAAALTTSAYYRARARRVSGTIPRAREGAFLLTLRGVMALALFLPVVLHALTPDAMRWATLDLPEPLRWAGAILGGAAVGLLHWVLRTLGANVSETTLTKERHELVTGGPYRRVRHPLYTTALLLFLAAGLMAESWLVPVAATTAAVLLRAFVVPREERALLEKFGESYGRYMERTGRFLPRRPVR